MFLLLALALLALLFGFVTALKWLFIIALILLILGVVSGASGRRNYFW